MNSDFANGCSPNGYDRLANPYRYLEYLLFRRQLETARVSLLGDLPDVAEALILGDGDGRFLGQFCSQRLGCAVTSVDHSGEMLRLQRQRVGELAMRTAVRWIHDDALHYRPQRDGFGALVTVFFLDCFTPSELPLLLSRWLAGLRPGGWFYFVDFIRPASGWRRIRADIYLSLMHRFFRWQTGLPNRRLVDLNAILAEQPIRQVRARNFSGNLITARLYQKR